LKLRNIKYECEKEALNKYKVLRMGKPVPISLSLYYNGKLIKWDGAGSHFRNLKQ